MHYVYYIGGPTSPGTEDEIRKLISPKLLQSKINLSRQCIASLHLHIDYFYSEGIYYALIRLI